MGKLIKEAADAEGHHADEAISELAQAVRTDVAAHVSAFVDELDVLAAVLVALGDDGIDAIRREIEDGTSTDLIMTHMAARMAVARIPGALPVLRAAAASSSEHVRESAEVWLRNRFDQKPRSTTFRQPPECYDLKYGPLRLWYKQGVRVAEWVRCPSCGARIVEKERHAIRCSNCRIIFADASYAPLMRRDRSGVIEVAPWRPFSAWEMKYWGVAKPWKEGPPGLPTVMLLGLLGEAAKW
jgi:ribosomal protein L37AE/L43A